MMTNEKPGGHGERSVAVGTIDMAVWDAVAKIEGKPLFQLLADRYGDGEANRKRLRLCRGRLLLPGQGQRGAAGRDARLPRPRLHGGQDEDRRRLPRRGPAPDRGGAGRDAAAQASSSPSTPTAASTWTPAIAYAKALARLRRCSGTRSRATRWTTRCRPRCRSYYPSPMATGENLFSMQDARNLIRYGGMRPDRDWLQFDCALSYGLVEYLRTLEMLQASTAGRQSRCIPHGGHQMSLEHRGRPRARRQRELPRPVPALRRLPGRRARRERARGPARPARHRLRRASRT